MHTADFEIMYGRRQFSVRFIRTADHITTCAVAVAFEEFCLQALLAVSPSLVFHYEEAV